MGAILNFFQREDIGKNPGGPPVDEEQLRQFHHNELDEAGARKVAELIAVWEPWFNAWIQYNRAPLKVVLEVLEELEDDNT